MPCHRPGGSGASGYWWNRVAYARIAIDITTNSEAHPETTGWAFCILLEGMVNMKKTIYTQEYQNLIMALREARRERGMRQQDVARKLGVSRNWVSKTELCIQVLDILQFVRLCHALELCPQEQLRTIVSESTS
jgi:DNA-binding XRE family transcriptional regulator